MRQEVVNLIIDGFKEAGIDTVVSLPESKFQELYPALEEHEDFRYIKVTNEGEGVSIAAGAWLGGKQPIMLMENAGLRVAVEPLSRFSMTHGIPVMMVMCYTGDIGEKNWWGVAHGITLEPLLDALRIPYIIVRKEEDVKDALQRAVTHMKVSLNHVAVILAGEVVTNKRKNEVS